MIHNVFYLPLNCINSQSVLIIFSNSNVLLKFAFFLFNKKNMNQSPPKKKKCQIKIQKDNYLRHLNRLQKLKEGRSPDQVKREIEEKKLKSKINTLRKMHHYNRSFQMKQRQQIERKTHFECFNRVKSVVKESFGWKPLTIAPKHKVSLMPIFKQNARIFTRLTNVKSQLSFQMQEKKIKLNENLSHEQSLDFSQLYQNSQLNQNEEIQFLIKLGNSKKYEKLNITIKTSDFCALFKDKNSLYAFEAQCGEISGRSQNFVPNDFPFLRLGVKIPQKNDSQQKISIRIMKILDSKQIFKGFFEISVQEVFETIENFDYPIEMEVQVLNFRKKSEGRILLVCQKKKINKKYLLKTPSNHAKNKFNQTLR